MCGGQVLIATCSRVGHVFRKVSPYTWPGGVVKILNHNTMRTVEVWMDDHKNFFYKINPSKVFCHFKNFLLQNKRRFLKYIPVFGFSLILLISYFTFLNSKHAFYFLRILTKVILTGLNVCNPNFSL